MCSGWIGEEGDLRHEEEVRVGGQRCAEKVANSDDGSEKNSWAHDEVECLVSLVQD